MERHDTLNHRDLESLKEGKVVAIVPQGISMLPFIKGGESRVYLLKKEKVEVGDIVLADYHGRHLHKQHERQLKPGISEFRYSFKGYAEIHERA